MCSEENVSAVSVNAPEPLEVAGEFQILRVDIDINNRPGKHSQFFVNCYRSPSGNLDTFFEQLAVVQEMMDRHRSKHVTFLGDFNIDLLKFNDETGSNVSSRLVDQTNNHGYIQIISRPTRITDHSATLIDHIYTNKILKDVLRSGVITYDISDHLGTYVSYSLEGNASTEQDLKFQDEYHKFNDENLATFRSLITKQDWSSVIGEQDPSR